jgi:hypothetical protein
VAVLQAAIATLTLDLKTATDRAAATDTVPLSSELEAAVVARDVAVTSAKTVGGSPSQARNRVHGSDVALRCGCSLRVAVCRRVTRAG